MKKIFLFLFLGCFFISLFSEEIFSSKSDSRKIRMQISPFICGDIFQSGYGLSLRSQVSGHTFELAPMYIPESVGMFGGEEKIGFTGSYYYPFFKDKFFQPYLGCSYTHLRELHRGITWHYNGIDSEPYKVTKDPIDQSNLISGLIGIQICSPNNNKKLSGYGFIDMPGPIGYDMYDLEIGFGFPRFGAGLQF